mgnify:CR=1 FL=1
MNKKWVQITVVVMMLLGMVIYLMTMDLSEDPIDENREEVPAGLTE